VGSPAASQQGTTSVIVVSLQKSNVTAHKTHNKMEQKKMSVKQLMFVLLTLHQLELHICLVYSFIAPIVLPYQPQRKFSSTTTATTNRLCGRRHERLSRVVATSNDVQIVVLANNGYSNKKVPGVFHQQSLLRATSRSAEEEEGEQEECSQQQKRHEDASSTAITTTTSSSAITPQEDDFVDGNSSSSRIVLLAKTRESFKLSDLYYLEAKLQAKSRNWTDTKLLSMDRNTGSYLLQLDSRFVLRDGVGGGGGVALSHDYDRIQQEQGHDDDDDDDDANNQQEEQKYHICRSPPSSCLDRLDWIAHGLVFGTSGQELVDNLVSCLDKKKKQQNHASDAKEKEDDDPFDFHCMFQGSAAAAVDYTCIGCLPQKDYTRKNLLCRISQIIPIPVALDLRPSCHNLEKNPLDLILIETQHGVYLANRLHGGLLEEKPSSSTASSSSSSSNSSDGNNLFLKQWSRRPFQYSSAVNPTVANILVNLLFDLTVQEHHHRHKEEEKQEDLRTSITATAVEEEMNHGRTIPIKILDPTVGSGTFLAFAIKYGMDVVGYDIEPKCVEGTIQNLQYLFPQEEESSDDGGCDGSSVSFLRAAKICVGDMAIGKHHNEQGDMFDCAVTNLPWGQNTEIRRKDDNLVSLVILCLYILK
jgi:hypothetical protein